MPVVKVVSEDRKEKFTVSANDLNSLKLKSANKLKLNVTDVETLQVIDDSDGSLIDDDDVLVDMAKSASTRGLYLLLMVLPIGSKWIDLTSLPVSVPSTPPTSRPSSPLINQLTPLSEREENMLVYTPLTSKSLPLPPVANFVAQLRTALDKPEHCRNKNLTRARRNVAKDIAKVFENRECNPGDVKAYATKVHTQCPEAFQVKIRSEVIGDGLNQFVKSIYNMIGYKKQVSISDCPNANSKKRRRIQLEEEDVVPLLCLDSNGCAEGMWDPALPVAVSAATLEDKRKRLAEYSNMPRCEDDINAKTLLKDTYSLQRSQINVARTIEDWREVFAAWSILLKKKFLICHCDMLLGKNIAETWYHEMSSSHTFLSFMESYCDKLSNSSSQTQRVDSLQDLIHKSREAEKNVNNSQPITVVMFLLLVRYLKEKESELFLVVPVTLTVEELFAKVQEVSQCPLVVVKGDSVFDENASFSVVIRGEFKIEVSNFVEGMLIVTISYFAFNICYPKALSQSLEFMQRFFLRINPEKVMRHEEKKRRTTVNSSIARLAGCLQEFEALQSRWSMADIS